MDSPLFSTMRREHREWRACVGLDPTVGWPGERYVLLHSLSHALINELAIECGVAGTELSTSARPYPSLTSVSRPRTTTIDTPGSSRAARNAFASESTVRRTVIGSERWVPCGTGCWAWSIDQVRHSASAGRRIFGMGGGFREVMQKVACVALYSEASYASMSISRRMGI